MYSRCLYSIFLTAGVISEIIQGGFPNEIKRAVRTHSKTPASRNSTYIASSTDIDQKIDINPSPPTNQPSSPPSKLLSSPTYSPISTKSEVSINSIPPEQTIEEPSDSISKAEPDDTNHENDEKKAQGDLPLFAIAAGLLGIFVAGYVVTKRIGQSRAKVPIDDDESVDYDQSAREEGYQDIEES